MMYGALGAIFLALLIFYRHPIKAAAPLAAALVAIGSSSFVIFVSGTDLNPLTSVSGPLIIAMSTEFSIILMSRYLEERSLGSDPDAAILSATTLVGRAITASALTVIGGFGVLAFSGFPLLNAFGRVTALNIGMALLTAVLVLPPILVWADRRFGLAPVTMAERTDDR
jgi:predicted RND superfamily exporter protein